jgi:hypothetical protein
MFWRRKFNSGALPDTRSQEKKDCDYVQSELVASIAPVVWVKKDKYENYPVRKQGQSGSCVMASLEKERGIIAKQKYGEFMVFSANPGYQLRANPNISGSTVEDLIKATNYGSIPEELSPSQSMNDLKMMQIKLPSYTEDMSKIFGAKRIFMDLDIDTVASTIENTGKGVGLTVMFGKGEWFGRRVVKEIQPPNLWTMGHRVTAVDYTLDDEGRKCLVIEDSACEDGYPVRLVPESFFLKRTYWKPNYILNFKKYEEAPDKPKYDGTIISAQNCLKYLGYFPSNVESTGKWLSVSRKACIAFQIANNITPALGNLGPITKAKLYELFP